MAAAAAKAQESVVPPTTVVPNTVQLIVGGAATELATEANPECTRQLQGWSEIARLRRRDLQSTAGTPDNILLNGKLASGEDAVHDASSINQPGPLGDIKHLTENLTGNASVDNDTATNSINREMGKAAQ